MRKAILYTHLFLPKSEIPSLEDLRKRYQFRSRFVRADGTRATVSLVREAKAHIGIPRYAPEAKRWFDVEDYTVLGPDIEPFNFVDDPNFAKRGHQDAALNQFARIVDNGGTGILLIAPTGSGKTVMALRMVAKLARPTLVVVHQENLIQQWRQRIKKHSTLTDDDIGLIRQNVCNFDGKRIVIGMMHSLTLRKHPYPKEIYDYFGTVVIDECHRTGAEQLGRVASMFPARYRIGLTATPRRTDGMDVVPSMTIGQHIIQMDQIQMPAPKVFVIPNRFGNPDLEEWLKSIQNDMLRMGTLDSRLASDRRRNAAIAKYIDVLRRKGYRVLLVSSRLKQIKLLYDMLLDRYRIPPGAMGKYVSGTNDEERARIERECSVILATFGAIQEGTDIPTLSALVWGTPRSSATQVVGRIRRYVPGKKPPVVIDLVDLVYSDCRVMLQRRLRHYATMGAEIVQVRR